MSAVFTAFKKEALYNRIAEQILSLVKARKLQPGDKLPSERELAQMMQVSRPSLRQALGILASMNVVDIRHGDGTYITSLETELLIERMDFVFSLDDSTYLQLIQARKVIEVGTASLAAQHITDEQITALEQCLAASQTDFGNFAAYDVSFHELIAEAANNPILTRFVKSISQLALASRSRTTTHSGTERAILAHQAILDALKARDPRGASAAMLRHLEGVEWTLMQNISQEDTEDEA
jgi:GntR family transcriptional regulator, transcriptional repressor for pyruvate dehydrogenase complex